MKLNPVLKTYLSTFLVMVLAMELSLMMVSAISGEWMEGWKYSVLPIVNGVIVASILVLCHLHGLRKVGVKEFNKVTLDPVQQREFDTQYSKSEIIDILKNARKTQRMSLSVEKNHISLDHSRWIFGQVINIYVKNVVNDLSHIVVESRPVSKIGVMDFGLSWGNVEYIKRLIQNP